MKLIEIQEKLNENKIKIFSKIEFRRLMRISQISAQKLLERYTEKGVFVRLKGGLYTLKLNCPSGYLIANKLYHPSYISFETALSYYNIIPETVYSFTSATTKTTRCFKVENQVFNYHKLKKIAYAGYQLIRFGEETVLFAEKEKALVDYFYYVFLGKKTLNERLQIRNLNKKKLLFYVSLFRKPNFLKWLKNAY
jgi:predicted transcriptional regulator of viral defense system